MTESIALVVIGTHFCHWDFFFSYRFFFQLSGGSTGAAGAFLPANFQQRVHCTRPDDELSRKLPLASQKWGFLV